MLYCPSSLRIQWRIYMAGKKVDWGKRPDCRILKYVLIFYKNTTTLCKSIGVYETHTHKKKTFYIFLYISSDGLWTIIVQSTRRITNLFSCYSTVSE